MAKQTLRSRIEDEFGKRGLDIHIVSASVNEAVFGNEIVEFTYIAMKIRAVTDRGTLLLSLSTGDGDFHDADEVVRKCFSGNLFKPKVSTLKGLSAVLKSDYNRVYNYMARW